MTAEPVRRPPSPALEPREASSLPDVVLRRVGLVQVALGIRAEIRRPGDYGPTSRMSEDELFRAYRHAGDEP